MSIQLSVLICSMASRERELRRLLNVLDHQKTPEVEVLVNSDDGTKTIGQKRNELVNQAKGKYVAFVDDDDLVSLDYVPRILEAASFDPDCIGIEGVMTTNGDNPKRFSHSRQYGKWFESGGVYYRTINHLNPVRREIALQVPFKDINWGEDRDYSERLNPLLTSEACVVEPIYFYLYERDGAQDAKPEIVHEMSLSGDFSYTATVIVKQLRKSAAGMSINGSIFGFEGKTGKMFVEGDLLKDVSAPPVNLVADGKPFRVQLVRSQESLTLWIRGERVFSVRVTVPKVVFGYRQMRASIQVENALVERPK